MKLTEFSVTNYRSITSAHKIKLNSFTVLVGKNNEGKSNLLKALSVAMNIMMQHGRRPFTNRPAIYDWERDFPIQFQNRKQGLESIFKLHFRLDDDELETFYTITGIRGNEEIPVSIKVGIDNHPSIEIPKRGSSSYNRNSKKITQFISERINFNYIEAVRTDKMAMSTLNHIIINELRSLDNNIEYINAIKKINELQQRELDKLSAQLIAPLKTFIPSLSKISIQLDENMAPNNYMRKIFDVYLNDGTETSISTKGEGIKSLVTLALLKERRTTDGVSVIAIEEPESHLHSGAIHSLVDVINKISENNQVIITTHNPLFVQRNRLNSNIIVDQGTARTAKSISEIRNTLGVWTSDNLKDARYVLLVEGDNDKTSLLKILPYYSARISSALKSNILIIKSLGGASNLLHDIIELRNSMCNFVVLLDNDPAGRAAAQKATEKYLINDTELKFTICNGSPDAEFEDCLNQHLYENVIKEQFCVDITNGSFRGNKKWSERMKNSFLSQGSQWNDDIEEKVKNAVANSIPSKIDNISNVIIEQKSGFLQGLATAIEIMLDKE